MSDNVKNTSVEKEKTKNVNFQLTVSDYEVLKEAAKRLGGMSVSALMRNMILPKISQYKETGSPQVFLKQE